MPWGIDQVEVVDLTIFGLVMQRGGLSFDGYPTLFLDVHRVENLSLHLAFFEAATALNQAIGECGFAVVNVRNDRKVSDVVHQAEQLSD